MLIEKSMTAVTNPNIILTINGPILGLKGTMKNRLNISLLFFALFLLFQKYPKLILNKLNFSDFLFFHFLILSLSYFLY
jgi:hypothetical protein